MLARMVIFLPSRRAALSLRESFLRVSAGRPLLLPRIEPLGDADEDALLLSPLSSLLPADMPSENFTLKRLFLLARLVQKQKQQTATSGERIDYALKLATPLAELLDELEREEITLNTIDEIVPDTFAAHWQITVEFLKILSRHWPEIAREERLVSTGSYNSQVLKALAQHWQDVPPVAPVIAAGTTGSNPATAALLTAIARLSQGFVVLPGLDTQADETYFEHLEESHPQWGMAQLLKKLDCTRADVQVIGQVATARVTLMSEVMRPAETSDAWQKLKLDKQEALKGIKYIPCDNTQEEAGVIALLLREALETPEKTAALVTHNRALARRVVAIMQRFDVTIDDSAGLPLKETPLATFLRLTLNVMSEAFAAVPLLSLLKHPLTHLGMERIACLEAARELEIISLRGLRTGKGLQGVRRAILKRAAASHEAHMLLDRLDRAYAPLLALKETSLSVLLEAHLACARALGSEEMWSGPEGEAVTQFFNEVREACEADNIIIEEGSYPAVFEELLAGRVYRPEYGMHPRLKILSPMEARMQSFDRIILGGLNEGSWPQQTLSDPWFSRPMRATLGLSAPERRLGLSAHDFFVLACGHEVILTRAGKEDGKPTTPSRWLDRLLMLASELPGQEENWTEWSSALDEPDSVLPVTRPEPRPPLAARPNRISVTQVETWMRDPYAIYASKILGLRALKPLAREPDGSDFGNAVHAALQDFVQAYPSALPADALSILLQYGKNAFAELFEGTGIEILWWPRFKSIAEWIIALEEERRSGLVRVRAEVEGECSLGEFQLHGRADRIEEGKDGRLAIIDYKTGTVPSVKDIEGGLSSQLVLLALIAREDGMAVQGDLTTLEYWQVQGGETAGKIKPIDPAKIAAHIEAAREGLMRLIARFNDASFPYRSIPISSRASRYSDYDHLARVKEWG